MSGAVRLHGEYLSLPQAAKLLGCSRQALATAVRRGILRAVRISPQKGRSFYLVSAEEIERYRREHLGRRGRPRKRKPLDQTPAGTTEGAHDP